MPKGKKNGSGGTSRRWCFTLNNPDAPLDFSIHPLVRYASWQKETGESGTPHYQGYIQTTRSCRLSQLKQIIPGAHFEAQRASDDDDAIAYTRKEEGRIDGPFEYGTRLKQGQRSDLAAVKEMIDGGATEAEVAEEHFSSFVRYHKSFTYYRMIKAKPRSQAPEVYVLYGGTGVGKSHWVRERFPNAFWLSRPTGKTLWWDGYTGQSCIIIDEFYGWIKYDYLLRLCDKNPLKLEIKGGFVECQASIICFTSNTRPDFWYKVGVWQAFVRRVTYWQHWYEERKFNCTKTYDVFIAHCEEFEPTLTKMPHVE